MDARDFMKKITYLNHASVLIQDGDNIILTDPWYKKPAFGSWLSVPPCLYNPAYFIALAKTNPKFSIVISHGHDDHFDDDFLSCLPSNTTVLLPKFDSIGPKKRLERCGLKNIIEFGEEGTLTTGGIEYKSFIFKDISMDDAFITIASLNFIVAHGNDNWQKLPDDVLKAVKEDFKKYKKEDTFFMSQTNMADGFPLIYENYTEEEKLELAKKRQDNMILSSVKNALSVNAGAFLSYAGMALPFIKNKEHLLVDAYCKSLDYIKNLLSSHKIKSDIVLDMVPGDSYDFNKVDKLFGTQYYNHEEIKQASIDFYKKYKWIDNCDTYQKPLEIGINKKEKYLSVFLDEFKSFVERKSYDTSFQEAVFKTKLTFKDKDVQKSISFSEDSPVDVSFTFDVVPMEKILTGELNWECCYIGYESTVKVNGDHNISALIRWLSMFGYVYQQRIWPKLKDE
jgi:hypothetical protein